MKKLLLLSVIFFGYSCSPTHFISPKTINLPLYSKSNNAKELIQSKYGNPSKVENQVKKLIKIAIEANLHGVICSPLEIKMIKEIAPKLKCFTPGIRMEGVNDDQKRTMTANEAIKEGSDCLIIGRPITKGNPKENIKNILSSID